MRRSVAARAMPASCVPQGRGVAPQACRLLACGKAGKGTAKPPARTCTILSIKRGPQPPLRGAKRQRRHSAADVRQRPAQARASARRSRARIDSGGTPPVRGRTGQAAFLRSAKAGRSQKIYRRGREPANRSSAAQAAAPWREETAEALRRGMVKKKT